MIARELAEDPRVLVAAQPTRGLDVGAIEFVHSKLLEQRDRGRAVLLISLELEELRNVADRLLVIADGQIVGEFPPDASDEELGLAMTGGRARTRPRERAGRRGRRPYDGRRPSSRAGPVTVASRLGGLHARRRHPRPAGHGADRVRGRRPRRAGDGLQPALDLQGDLRRHRLNWLLPWTSSDDRIIAAQNLQQTLIITAPLILTGLAVGARLPRRPVQHRRQRPVHRGHDRRRCSSAPASRACPASCTSCWRCSPPWLAGAAWAGLAGWLRASTGPTR